MTDVPGGAAQKRERSPGEAAAEEAPVTAEKEKKKKVSFDSPNVLRPI